MFVYTVTHLGLVDNRQHKNIVEIDWHRGLQGDKYDCRLFNFQRKLFIALQIDGINKQATSSMTMPCNVLNASHYSAFRLGGGSWNLIWSLMRQILLLNPLHGVLSKSDTAVPVAQRKNFVWNQILAPKLQNYTFLPPDDNSLTASPSSSSSWLPTGIARDYCGAGTGGSVVANHSVIRGRQEKVKGGSPMTT